MKVLKGAYISHFQYGLGIVMESNSDYTEIDFDVHGMKKFVTAIVALSPADGTPPVRRKRRKKK